MRHKHLIGILLLLLLTACGRHRQADALLSQADSLMASRPDSAYALLTAVTPDERSDWRKADRMRYELTLAEAMNKAYKDFTTDSVMKLVVRYYDRRGSHNDQLKARYLLGCAYRDMGEAPAAINAWQEAVERADSTSADCDYNTLYRVYGQMADLFIRQYLTTDALEAQQLKCHYALLSGDTLIYIHGLLMLTDIYYAMNDTASVFQHIEKARNLYLERGMAHEAAQVYPTAIQAAIEYGQYERARKMLLIFEQESGLFDKSGRIQSGYQKFYYHKGNYYWAIHLPDSAEVQFRKLLNYEPNLVDAYRGLMGLFQSENKTDSALKYARLYESALVRYLNATQTDAVRQAASMYDYTRHEQEARVKSQEAQRIMRILLGVLISAVLIIGFVYYAYRRYRNKKVVEALRLSSLYQAASKKLSSASEELNILKNDHETLERLKQEYAEKLQHQIEMNQELNNQAERDQTILKDLERQNSQIKEDITEIQKNKDLLIAKREKEIKALRSDILVQRAQLKKLKAPEREMALKETDIVKLFCHIRYPHHGGDENQPTMLPARKASEDEWNELFIITQSYLPSFYAFLTEAIRLTPQEYKACILFRLDFTGEEIATLIGTPSSRISKLKGILNSKLFKNDDISMFFTNLKRL